MAVTGYLQPNEQVVYRQDASGETNDPVFVRHSYSFEGIDTVNPPQSGALLDICRNAASGTPLPGPTDPPPGFAGASLPQTRVLVRRYREQVGEARIVVEWGVRFLGGGGATPLLTYRNSSVRGTTIEQPYAIRNVVDFPPPGVVQTFAERATRRVPRSQIQTTYTRLITFGGSFSPDTIDLVAATRYGQLFMYQGAPRVLVGVSTRPISATQGYVSTTFVINAPVPAVNQGVVLSEVQGIVTRDSLAVEALGFNEEYAEPTLADGTLALAADVAYTEGITGELFWL